MSQHFTVTLLCKDCGAKIGYINEIPYWRADIATPEERQIAIDFVADNPHVSRWVSLPPFVGRRWENPNAVSAITKPMNSYTNWTALSYVPCPACNGPVYMTTPEESNGSSN